MTVAQLLRHLVKARVLTIHLIDNKHTAYATLHGVLERLFRAYVEAGDAADHDARSLYHAQGADHLADKIKVAGNVDDVQHLAVPVDGSAGGTDGTLALVLFGLEVGHGRAVLNLALTVDNAGSEEHRLR